MPPKGETRLNRIMRENHIYVYYCKGAVPPWTAVKFDNAQDAKRAQEILEEYYMHFENRGHIAEANSRAHAVAKLCRQCKLEVVF